MKYLRVTNWSEYQHYRNRRAPWIKAYTGILDALEHPTFTKLTDGAKLTLHHLRLLAGVTGNQIPETWITSGHLNMHAKPRVTELFDAKFIEWIPESELSSLANRGQSDTTECSAPRARGRARSQSLSSSLGVSLEEKDEKKHRTGARELIENFAVTDKHRAWAVESSAGTDVDTATDAWRDHCRANDYRTRQGPIRDADASWRNWMRNEVKFSRGRNGNRDSENRNSAGANRRPTPSDVGSSSRPSGSQRPSKFNHRPGTDLLEQREVRPVLGDTPGGPDDPVRRL